MKSNVNLRIVKLEGAKSSSTLQLLKEYKANSSAILPDPNDKINISFRRHQKTEAHSRAEKAMRAVKATKNGPKHVEDGDDLQI